MGASDLRNFAHCVKSNKKLDLLSLAGLDNLICPKCLFEVQRQPNQENSSNFSIQKDQESQNERSKTKPDKRNAKNSDDIEDRMATHMGDFLMQGWTMLANTCDS